MKTTTDNNTANTATTDNATTEKGNKAMETTTAKTTKKAATKKTTSKAKTTKKAAEKKTTAKKTTSKAKTTKKAAEKKTTKKAATTAKPKTKAASKKKAAPKKDTKVKAKVEAGKKEAKQKLEQAEVEAVKATAEIATNQPDINAPINKQEGRAFGTLTCNFEDIVLHPSFPNMRDNMGDLSGIEGSIKDSGLENNLTVWRTKEGGVTTLILISGFRRHAVIDRIRGEHPAFLNSLEVNVFEGSFGDALFHNINENAQRKNPNLLEFGRQIKAYMEAEGVTQRAAAERISKSESWVSTALKVADDSVLIKPIREKVADGTIGFYLARQILKEFVSKDHNDREGQMEWFKRFEKALAMGKKAPKPGEEEGEEGTEKKEKKLRLKTRNAKEIGEVYKSYRDSDSVVGLQDGLDFLQSLDPDDQKKLIAVFTYAHNNGVQKALEFSLGGTNIDWGASKPDATTGTYSRSVVPEGEVAAYVRADFEVLIDEL